MRTSRFPTLRRTLAERNRARLSNDVRSPVSCRFHGNVVRASSTTVTSYTPYAKTAVSKRTGKSRKFARIFESISDLEPTACVSNGRWNGAIPSYRATCVSRENFSYVRYSFSISVSRTIDFLFVLFHAVLFIRVSTCRLDSFTTYVFR